MLFGLRIRRPVGIGPWTFGSLSAFSAECQEIPSARRERAEELVEVLAAWAEHVPGAALAKAAVAVDGPSISSRAANSTPHRPRSCLLDPPQVQEVQGKWERWC